MRYRVQWEIDIDDAEDHQHAAEQALDIMRDPSSTATVFFVTMCDEDDNPMEDWETVDLDS